MRCCYAGLLARSPIRRRFRCGWHSLTEALFGVRVALLPLWVVFSGTRRVGRHVLPKAVVELHALQRGVIRDTAFHRFPKTLKCHATPKVSCNPQSVMQPPKCHAVRHLLLESHAT
jgi:hypothetical protein